MARVTDGALDFKAVKVFFSQALSIGTGQSGVAMIFLSLRPGHSVSRRARAQDKGKLFCVFLARKSVEVTWRLRLQGVLLVFSFALLWCK